jgi:hypothetical protein
MFGWWKKRESLSPEKKWHVAIKGDLIGVTDDAGEGRSIALALLSGVAIETNDSGPWGADLWWLLFDKDDHLACQFPQGATGEQSVVDQLMALPGFDHGRMIEAMRSTDNAIFPVWRKPG